MEQSQHKKVLDLINKKPKGTIFVLSDFSSVGTKNTVSKILERLAKEGKIVKIKRGIFWKNNSKELLPSIPDLVDALARTKSWTIIPTGQTALYQAGLSSKEPEIWTYITNGSTRSYEFNGKEIEFQSDRTNLRNYSTDTRLLIEIIKAYGKTIPINFKESMNKLFNSKQIKRIVVETKYLTRKLSLLIKSLFTIEEDKKEEKRYE